MPVESAIVGILDAITIVIAIAAANNLLFISVPSINHFFANSLRNPRPCDEVIIVLPVITSVCRSFEEVIDLYVTTIPSDAHRNVSVQKTFLKKTCLGDFCPGVLFHVLPARETINLKDFASSIR